LLAGNNGPVQKVPREFDAAMEIRKTGTWQSFPVVRKFCGTN
jgi:hypothetical protein